MNETSPTLTFFGSGPVAAESLAYIAEHFSVELVVTKRRPAHHKDPAPVEEYANKHALKLVYADTKQELEAVINEQQPTSPCGIVIDYGVIISQAVIDYFPMGILNSHFSILPEWRGADPITFSLLSGQSTTGVSLMRIDAGLDTGAIIAETNVTIASNDTNQSLTSKLIDASNVQIQTIVPLYIAGQAVPIPQSSERVTTYSRKLTKQDCWLDSTKPAAVLEREIRAFSDWPKSKLTMGDTLTVIVTAATVNDEQRTPGSITITDQKEIIIGTRVGSLLLTELMPLGKQKMTAAAFLNGYGSRINQTVG